MSLARMALAGQLPADMPEETRAAVLAAADLLSPADLLPIMSIAQEARAQLDAGDRDGAAATIDGLRPMAEQWGLLPLFDQMRASVLAG